MVLTARASEEDSRLARGLGLLDATTIVVGSMIGSGIFIVSAESSRLVGAPGWLLVVWAIAGLMTITGALCCAELAAMMPRAGGQYVFLREAYRPGTAFLFGWSFLLVIQTGAIAAVAIAFANFMGVLTDRASATTYVIAPIVFGGYALSLSTQQLVAVAMILLLTVREHAGTSARETDSEHLHRALWVLQDNAGALASTARMVSSLTVSRRRLKLAELNWLKSGSAKDSAANLRLHRRRRARVRTAPRRGGDHAVDNVGRPSATTH